MKNIMIFGLVLGAATITGYANGIKQDQAHKEAASSESEGVYFCKVGQFEVYMLVESQREGNAGILVGADGSPADEAVLAHYIPKSGFMHTANAFLIKTPTQNILVDTGTGAGGIILEKVKKLGVPPEQVNAVLITHLHGDHFGSLQKDGAAVFPRAKVYLSAKEHEFFTKTNKNDGAAAALAPYGEKVTLFEPGSVDSPLNILPGIGAIANYGHTPGHTVYLVENGGSKQLIAGDFLHVGLVQFAEPDISASYDMDKAAAAASRRQILTYAAQNKIPIGGMHVVYPGVGLAEADGAGFRFIPGVQ